MIKSQNSVSLSIFRDSPALTTVDGVERELTFDLRDRPLPAVCCVLAAVHVHFQSHQTELCVCFT